MICERTIKKFCKDDISLIENYDKAIADKTQVWHCHHRRETIYSRSGLIEIGEYYNRPAEELIFLTPNEHQRLHNLGKHHSAEARKKLSEANKGKQLSEETRKKLSEANKGKQLSEETRKKIAEANKGKQLSEETRKKMSESRFGEKNPFFGKHLSTEHRKKLSEALKGKHKSAETRKKLSEAHKGKHKSAEHRKKLSEARKGNHWYNNGVTSILAKTCPDGFVPGRIVCNKRS